MGSSHRSSHDSPRKSGHCRSRALEEKEHPIFSILHTSQPPATKSFGASDFNRHVKSRPDASKRAGARGAFRGYSAERAERSNRKTVRHDHPAQDHCERESAVGAQCPLSGMQHHQCSSRTDESAPQRQRRRRRRGMARRERKKKRKTRGRREWETWREGRASRGELTPSHLGGGVSAAGARLLLNVERPPPAPPAGDVRLGVTLSERGGTLGHGGLTSRKKISDGDDLLDLGGRRGFRGRRPLASLSAPR